MSQIDSDILQLFVIPCRILVPSVTQLFRSNDCIFFFQCRFKSAYPPCQLGSFHHIILSHFLKVGIKRAPDCETLVFIENIGAKRAHLMPLQRLGKKSWMRGLLRKLKCLESKERSSKRRSKILL